jgi:hypothetical protein
MISSFFSLRFAPPPPLHQYVALSNRTEFGNDQLVTPSQLHSNPILLEHKPSGDMLKVTAAQAIPDTDSVRVTSLNLTSGEDVENVVTKSLWEKLKGN